MGPNVWVAPSGFLSVYLLILYEPKKIISKHSECIYLTKTKISPKRQQNFLSPSFSPYLILHDLYILHSIHVIIGFKFIFSLWDLSLLGLTFNFHFEDFTFYFHSENLPSTFTLKIYLLLSLRGLTFYFYSDNFTFYQVFQFWELTFYFHTLKIYLLLSLRGLTFYFYSEELPVTFILRSYLLLSLVIFTFYFHSGGLTFYFHSWSYLLLSLWDLDMICCIYAEASSLLHQMEVMDFLYPWKKGIFYII